MNHVCKCTYVNSLQVNERLAAALEEAKGERKNLTEERNAATIKLVRAYTVISPLQLHLSLIMDLLGKGIQVRTLSPFSHSKNNM